MKYHNSSPAEQTVKTRKSVQRVHSTRCAIWCLSCSNAKLLQVKFQADGCRCSAIL